MPQLPRSSLPDQVFRRLVGAVLDGRYAAGERLPPQRALAAELGVNMASLREGIKRLEQLRLVEVRHGDAMRVRDWRAHGGLDVLAHAAPSADPALTARAVRGPPAAAAEAARLAAARRSDEQARAAAPARRRLAAARDDARRRASTSRSWRTVIDAAGNLVFTLIMNSIRELYLAAPRAASGRSSRDREALAPLYARRARRSRPATRGARRAASSALAAVQEARCAMRSRDRRRVIAPREAVDLRRARRHRRRARAAAAARRRDGRRRRVRRAGSPPRRALNRARAARRAARARAARAAAARPRRATARAGCAALERLRRVERPAAALVEALRAAAAMSYYGDARVMARARLRRRGARARGPRLAGAGARAGGRPHTRAGAARTAPPVAAPRTLRADVCVIGAGAGGAPVARALAEARRARRRARGGRRHRRRELTGAPARHDRPPLPRRRPDRDARHAADRAAARPRASAARRSSTRAPASARRTACASAGAPSSASTAHARDLDAAFDARRARAPRHRGPTELAGAQRAVATPRRRGARLVGPLPDRNARGCQGSGVCAFGCPTGAKQHTGVTYMRRRARRRRDVLTGARARSGS